MNFLKKLLDSLSTTTKSGVFAPMHPFIDAVNTGLFDPDFTTTKAPYIRDHLNTKRYIISVVIALMPAFFVALYAYGIKVLVLLLIAYAEGGIIENIFAYFKKEDINEGFLVTGLLLVLIFPVSMPYWVFAIAVAFGIIFGKEIFGGVGHNIFNPALTGRVFVFLSWPALVAPSKYIIPSGHLFNYISTAEDAITSASPLASNIQPSVWSLLFDLKNGCIGEVSALALILGGIYLIVVKVINWRIPLGMILGAIFFTILLQFFNVKAVFSIDKQILTGGFLLGALFMATDPVTAPMFNASKWFYGILVGILVILFRQFTPLTEGVMFAILFMNMFAPLLDEIFINLKIKKEAKYEKQ